MIRRRTQGMEADVVVIGGGFAGLSCARALSTEHLVVLAEAGSVLGGLCSSYRWDGLTIPRYCHNLLSTDGAAIDLMDHLGLSVSVRWEPVDTLIRARGRFWDVTSARGLITFSPLPLSGRLRLGFLSLQALLGIPQGSMEGASARDWLRSRVGSAATDGFFEPLSWVKYKQGLEGISASWLWDRLVNSARMGNRSAILGPTLERALDTMARGILEAGSTLMTGSKVTGLQAGPGRCRVLVECPAGRKELEARAVVLCLPPPAAARIGGLPAALRESLSRIRYKAIVNACFLLDRPLMEANASLVVPGRDLPFGGVIHHFLDRYGGSPGRALAYVYSYVDASDSLWRSSDEEVLATFRGSLEYIFPGFERSVAAGRVARDAHASPVFTSGFDRLLPSDRDMPAEIFHAGPHLLYPRMPTIGTAVESGVGAAGRAAGYLAGS